MARNGQPVDLAHLDRYTGGDRGVNAEILGLFERQCAELLAKLERLAKDEPDPKAWHSATHTLKGAARGIGAFELGDAAAEAEKAADVMTALERLKITSAAVHVFIETFLQGRP